MSFRHHLGRCLLPGLLASAVSGWSAASAWAQRPAHPLYRVDLPPGVIGATQVAASVARQGYVQPVRLQVPQGAFASIAADGGFATASTQLTAGLIVGQPYRFRITNIPRNDGQELYPSIELIDRLYPPSGQKNRFPVPIQLTQDDLETALRGNLVVRVVYVENPADAFPKAETSEQRSIDVLASEDPLHVADELGRPIAIVRVGSRVPLQGELDDAFLFGCPPVEWISEVTSAIELAAPVIESSVENRAWEHN
jgi:hypothetical protein